MEKGNSIKPINVVITGPESTGKSELCVWLSEQIQAVCYPEYARDYVEGLGRFYNYTDVENIAIKQIEQYSKAQQAGNKFILFDTGLIITKVWFDVVYGKCPQFVLDFIANQTINLHLLCNTDLPWIPDSVRENGGKNRVELFNKYKEELDNYKFTYEIVSGIGSERFESAKKAMLKHNLL